MRLLQVLKFGALASTAMTGVAGISPAWADSTPVVVPAPASVQPSGVTSTPPASTDSRPITPQAGEFNPTAGFIRNFSGEVSGTAGFIRNFQGDTAASAGFIRNFAGFIRNFSGDVRAYQNVVNPATGPSSEFWGRLSPKSGSLSADAGFIRNFSATFDGSASTLRTATGALRSTDGSILPYMGNEASYGAARTSLTALIASSKATWGAAVQQRTGQTFEAAFANKYLAKWHLDLTDPTSMANIDPVNAELFLLDWYDNLSNYSGQDQVDHWMKEVNWSPSLTQQVIGGGANSKIGLLDFTVTGDDTANIVSASGISTVTKGHGSAVASLMVAAHDGRGVMGIAPAASVVTYNPFDSTYTAGWTDIRNGVVNLASNGATIINMSLGVPGWTLNGGWNDVFKEDAVSAVARSKIFVMAAGNDGITQTQNVAWAFDKNPYILVVGSVRPDGTISDFSNRPGTVCLTKADGKCDHPDTDKLMSRFIVAPGEFMLVSDGQGGVTRMSGTSFAAPLVSGTIALIHDRWPWLASKPKDVVGLILKSAKDLGAPGVDAVYGAGLLDVTAALSPLSFDQLKYYTVVGGQVKEAKTKDLRGNVSTNQRATWQAAGAYVTLIEDTGDSYRDFSVPLSTKLVGQTVGASGEQFNAYLSSRFWTWASAPAGRESGDDFTGRRFAGFTGDGLSSRVGGFGDAAATVTLRPRAYRPGLRRSSTPYDAAIDFRDPAGRFGLAVGSGEGSVALGRQAGFGLSSDYDVATGGANPFLAMASGGGYAAMSYKLGSDLTVNAGLTAQTAKRDLTLVTISERQALAGVAPYHATATTIGLDYRAASWLTASATYTTLHEKTGLLGMQSIDPTDFASGSTTDAATLGIDAAITPTLSLTGAATLGRTRTGDTGRDNLVVSQGGLMSTAFQVGVTKQHVLGYHDRIRVLISQPMHIEAGSLDYQSVQVVDRQTGELGSVTQHIALQSPQRMHVVEGIYGRSLMNGQAQIGLFGRMRLGGTSAVGQPAAVAAGTNFQLRF